MSWKKLRESVQESLNDHMRLRNDYLMAENRILRHQIDGRVQLTDSERLELAEIGVKLGKKALAEIATVAQPDTILAWNRKFANQPTDTSKRPKSVGRPRVDKEIEDWVVRMARENRSWGYDRIQGSLKHLGYTISDQTVDNILKRHGVSPAPERQRTMTWREFIRSHWDVLVATDFFGGEVWSWFGLALSCLFDFIDGCCSQMRSVKASWPQYVQRMHAIARDNFNLKSPVKSGNNRIKALPRSQIVQFSKGTTGLVMAFAPDAEQPARSLAIDKVVALRIARCRAIRDGPDASQQQLDRLHVFNERAAA
jgi:transposase